MKTKPLPPLTPEQIRAMDTEQAKINSELLNDINCNDPDAPKSVIVWAVQGSYPTSLLTNENDALQAQDKHNNNPVFTDRYGYAILKRYIVPKSDWDNMKVSCATITNYPSI